MVAQLSRMPQATNVTSRLDPPYDSSGSGMPMTGSRPSTMPMLMIACDMIQMTMPAAV